ncbi:hypothetical protein BU26DRAFT_225641 [Trematosphaeria pertusa]|uniref:EthD domain-containing protein n=1 Tax=Trematosphaeria pertusa TaxID=390896 RepID=A0A6A6IT60_9PLEO|nr:uncharacterized protein BU26DRAFT_225641 [Trematosphaeria pertusa]KAF2253586.1 hypothetical protein BU26DRAFT_225641 [Trematosphaeria pertusa]
MTTKPAQASVLYPRKDGATFNMAYYLSTHMPLVASSWAKYGLKRWSVTQLGPDSPYSVLVWESLEAFDKAAKGAEAGDVFGDIERFSSEQLVLCAGEVVRSR